VPYGVQPHEWFIESNYVNNNAVAEDGQFPI